MRVKLRLFLLSYKEGLCVLIMFVLNLYLMMRKQSITLLLLMAFMAAGLQSALAQESDSRDCERGWYVGLSGGTSFGQATFRSISESKTNVGAQFGVLGGYQFSRLFSVEALATMGWQKQTSLDCDPYWLATDGEFTFAPVLGKQGNYYRDLEAKTQWMRLGLQANFNVLSLITKPICKWSVTLSPQVSAVTTRTKHLATGYEQEFDRQWHLGLGGQAAVGYRVARNFGLQLYGGITCLTGNRFDNIPKYCHKSNLIYEAGLKLSYHFGKKKQAPVVEEPAVITEPEPQPVVEQQPDMTLSIIGHASNIGSKQYNRKLSQRRANSVKRQLVAKGIAASRLHPVKGRGIDHTTADSRQARRVELIINEK